MLLQNLFKRPVHKFFALFITVVILFIIPLSLAGEGMKSNRLSTPKLSSADAPYVTIRVHDVGKIGLSVSNTGMIGTGYFPGEVYNPETGSPAPSCEYPINSGIDYLYGGLLWIGGIIEDTQYVSTSSHGYFGQVKEMWPLPYPDGDMEHKYPGDEAESDKDCIAVYYDTLTDVSYVNDNSADGRPHFPLGLEITQKSYSWSDEGAEDFVLIEYTLINISENIINDCWIGFLIDGDVGFGDFGPEVPNDDLAGFLESEKIAYIIDNDGDPLDDNNWSENSSRGAIGLKLLGAQIPPETINFNWRPTIMPNWGPRLDEDPFYYFTGGGLGIPKSDSDGYYILSHPEVDYDQLWTKVDMTGEGWIEPPSSPSAAEETANGCDICFYYSFGPYNLLPQNTFKFTMALIMGDNVHVNPDDFSQLFDADNPQEYYESLDFSDLINNANVAFSYYCASCGDVNADCRVNVLDILFLIQYKYWGGEPPEPLESADVNSDSVIDVLDILCLIDYKYNDGPEPNCP